jgi:hypothetical protein
MTEESNESALADTADSREFPRKRETETAEEKQARLAREAEELMSSVRSGDIYFLKHRVAGILNLDLPRLGGQLLIFHLSVLCLLDSPFVVDG